MIVALVVGSVDLDCSIGKIMCFDCSLILGVFYLKGLVHSSILAVKWFL